MREYHTAISSTTYAVGLEAAYFGELVAERVYRALARHNVDPVQREKLCRIADVERLMADGLAPIARRLRVSITDPTIEARVHKRSEELESMTWDEFVASADEAWPPFIEQFVLLASLAPKEDAEVMKRLVAHERALVEFVSMERNPGTSLKSLDPLNSFLCANAGIQG